MPIYTHPNNITWLREYLSIEEELRTGIPDSIHGLEIIPASHIPEFEWSGKYVARDGIVIDPQATFFYSEPFCTYSNDDLSFLIWSGKFKRHMFRPWYHMEPKQVEFFRFEHGPVILNRWYL